MNFQNYSKNTPNLNKLYSQNMLLLLDMEGIIGIRGFSFDEEKSNIQLAYNEISFVIDILKDLGFRNFTVCNIHNDGKGLEKTALKKIGAELIEGIHQLPSEITKFSCAIMLGFHGKSHSGGRFDHTFRPDIKEILYGNECIGEVGMYYRWLLNNNVPVIMISGEGNFKNEIKDFPCSFHNIQHYSENEDVVLNEYENLKSAIYNSINFFKRNMYLKDDILLTKKIIVKVDNCDKYFIMKQYYKSINNSGFMFDSLEAFFNNLFDFAMKLNAAEVKIYKNNIRFMKLLKQKIRNPYTLEKLFYPYLDKAITEIDYKQRIKIANEVGMKYEDFVVH